MQPQSTISLPQNKWVKIGLLLIPVLVILILIAVFIRPSPDIQKMDLTSTDLVKDRHFSHLKDSKLYFYNGSGFFSADLDTEKDLNELHSGAKLPTPSLIYWAGSHGVLMNFESSFLYTRVEEALDKKGLSLNDETRNYTWYFDFGNGSLRLVNKLPLKPGSVSFSSDKSGFYYVPDHSQPRLHVDSAKPPDSHPLRFYNIDNHKDREMVDDLGVTDISSVQPCDIKDFEVCIVARNRQQTSQSQLIGVSEESYETLFNTQGSIFPTNDPDLFLLAEQETEEEEGSDEFFNVEQKPAVLYNVQDDSKLELGVDISNSNVFPYFDGNGNFAIIDEVFFDDPEYEDYYQHIIGKIDENERVHTELAPLRQEKGEYLTDRIINMSDLSSNHLLLEARGNKQLLFGAKSPKNKLKRLDAKTAENIVENCSSKHGDDSQFTQELQQFRVFFQENKSMEQNMRKFTKCVYEQNPRLHIGYNFQFEIVSQYNGRIISD